MAVGAVIVTYHPDAQIATILSAISAQADKIFIVDNASPEEARTILKQFVQDHIGKVFFYENQTNIGLAAAQNQAIRAAIAQECDWILLFDDDSLPVANMVTAMLTAYEQQQDSRIGIVAPLIKDINTQSATHYLVPCHKIGFYRKTLEPGHVLTDAATVIASGSLIRTDVFKTIGLMRDGLFIDYIDHDFCLRAQLGLFRILVAGDALLMHELGKKQEHKALGTTVITSNHSALRRYYIFRNRMFILRAHGMRFPFLYTHECLAYGWDIARIVLLEREKMPKLRAALRGLWHGLTQPMPPVEWL